MLEGSKNLVRWTQGLPIEPLFGSATPPLIALVAVTTLSAANLVAGLLILRTRWMGSVFGAAVIAGQLLATVVHREAFIEWAAKATVARRALQGVPVRDGEIEMMKGITATVLPIVMIAETTRSAPSVAVARAAIRIRNRSRALRAEV